MRRQSDAGGDTLRTAITAAAIVVVAATFAATQWDVASRVGSWLTTATSGPFVRNAVLVLATLGPGVVASVALRGRQRDAGARRELAERSVHDSLTGLPNREQLISMINRGIRTTRDGTTRCAVLFCDLDRFKQVNDTYGHEVGDQLMVAVGERISGLMEDHQWALRYGGDEFVIVAGDLRGPLDAERLAGRLLRALESPFELGIDTVRISASIGVALTERSGSDPHDLLRDADLAMYTAKLEGHNIRMYERTMRGRISRADTVAELASAVEAGELSVWYHPVLSVLDGALAAVRAEVHWHSEDHADLSARELSVALEETGLMVRVGAWCIEQACRDARRWNEVAPNAPAVQVLVPVSTRLLARASFRDQVAEALAVSGARRNQLCLVVGSHSLSGDISDAWTMLRHVRTLGVQVVLDGFGASGSSLGDLREARLDQLCIDPVLVSGLDHEGHGGEDSAIVEHAVALAHQLGVVVTAERVTNAGQLAVLRRLGCDRASGPFVGTALRPEDVELLVPRSLQGLHRRETLGTAQPALPRLRAFGGSADV